MYMLQAAAVFSDNMVLQRDKKIRVFGTGESGSRIRVTLLNKTAEAVCREGKWIAYLPEFEAVEDAVMEITDGKTTLRFINIAIGEVWLAGGQSNMELELQNADGGQEILQNFDSAQKVVIDGAEMSEAIRRVRFYYTPKVAYECEALWEAEKNSRWELFGKEAAAKWSAVGFFYAVRLAEKLGVTVGVIGCNWGGTSASAWMSREALLEQEATKSYVEEYENSEWVKKSRAEQIKDYDEYLEYHADWERRAGKIYEENPRESFDRVQELVGPCRYPGPMNCANFTRPAGLYEVMLRKIAPYTMRGFLYYQGESDEHKPKSYYALLTRMMRQWREDFLDHELFFLLVQLPMHQYEGTKDDKSWCMIREAQLRAYENIKNTGLAVIIDCGQFHEIHPRNKQPVGERLALQALCQVYHRIEAEEAFGPLYRDFLYRDGGMEIFFRYAKEGFLVKGAVPSGFEIAGEDGVFYPAKAGFTEKGDSVFLKAAQVERPLMARYLWTNYAEVNVFGKNGLPTAPFRTHLFDE